MMRVPGKHWGLIVLIGSLVITINISVIYCSMLCSTVEFNGFLKTSCIDEHGKRVYKCVNSDDYYEVRRFTKYIPSTFNRSCPADNKMYQACGASANDVANIGTDGDTFCGSYICDNIMSGNTIMRTLSDICAPIAPCIIADAIKKKCATINVGGLAGVTGQSFKYGLYQYGVAACDDKCDLNSCEDEKLCNGYNYGLTCLIRPSDQESVYLDQQMICDGYRDCSDGSDEINCMEMMSRETCTSGIIRLRELRSVRVPIFNFTRCGSFKYKAKQLSVPYCANYMDQTNCSDPEKGLLTCSIRGYESTVSRSMVCSEYSVTLCDDGLEKSCVKVSPSCSVHKHLLCDGVDDCSDTADEHVSICGGLASDKCFRKYRHGTELRILLSWIGDGVEDCLDGRDEKENWPECSSGRTRRIVSRAEQCRDVYVCRDAGPLGYINLHDVCDGVDTCGYENKVCEASRGSPSLHLQISQGEDSLKKHFSYCVSGLSNLQMLAHPCMQHKFNFFHSITLGVKDENIYIPETLFDCTQLFGEAYVYLDCLNRCFSATCPLKRPILHNSCSHQFPDRVITVTNTVDLTFAVKSGHGLYHNNFFLCKNNNCLEYSRVCNLVDECGDGSDEEECTNHFRCNATKELIPASAKCDGKMDCLDLSDECNCECGKEIIPGKVLKVTTWLISISAVILNIMLFVKNISLTNKSRNRVVFSTHVQMCVICVGDFLVGVYLLLIVIVDKVYGRGYCLLQTQWRSSVYCSLLGVLSTVGSQLSLFSMTILSINRLFSVHRSKTKINKRTKIKSLVKIQMAFLVLTVFGFTVFLSTIPLVETFEDLFVNGIAYHPSLRLFIGNIDKETHIKVLQEYYGRLKVTFLKWSLIESMVDGMFTQEYGQITRSKVNFYGNVGVCLFKYLVGPDDPQKYFTWSLLILNMVCFIVITVSYTIINTMSTAPTKNMVKGGGLLAKRIKERNKNRQRKISAIILTDFICWFPFTVICFLHTLEVLDATPFYAIFSVVLLPINSVINPLIYGNVFGRIKKRMRKREVRTAAIFNNVRAHVDNTH